MTQIEPTAPAIDILLEARQWDGAAYLESWVRRAVEAALAPEHANCALAVVLTDDESMRALNARFRGVDCATNVLAFPAALSAKRPAECRLGDPVLLGDVVIAFETAMAEAAAEGKEFGHHVAHLLVHGVLHLLGYDHHSDAEAEAMEARERAILMRLDIPDPYSPRARVAFGQHRGA